MEVPNATVEDRVCSFVEGCTLRSRIPGRDRWLIAAILEDRRFALALATVLRSEVGVKQAIANHLTGRLLVEYSPEELQEPVEVLIRRALAFGPMSAGEFKDLKSSTSHPCSPLRVLVSAELGCLLAKLLFAGIACPTVGAAAGVVFTVVALSRSRARSGIETPETSTPVRIEIDQAG